MSVTEYSSLPQQEKVEIVEEVAEGNCDDSHRDLLVDQTKTEVETSSFYPLGEPVSSVHCDRCSSNIHLEKSCAAIKRFACADDPEKGTIERTPEIICNSCAGDSHQLAGQDMVGVLVRGVLERRRTRPGDDSDAPYLLYISRTDSANVKIVRSDEDDGPTRPDWKSVSNW